MTVCMSTVCPCLKEAQRFLPVGFSTVILVCQWLPQNSWPCGHYACCISHFKADFPRKQARGLKSHEESKRVTSIHCYDSHPMINEKLHATAVKDERCLLVTTLKKYPTTYSRLILRYPHLQMFNERLVAYRLKNKQVEFDTAAYVFPTQKSFASCGSDRQGEHTKSPIAAESVLEMSQLREGGYRRMSQQYEVVPLLIPPLLLL